MKVYETDERMGKLKVALDNMGGVAFPFNLHGAIRQLQKYLDMEEEDA